MANQIAGRSEGTETGKWSSYLFRNFLSISIASIVIIVVVSIMGLRSILLRSALFEAESDALLFSVAVSELEVKRLFGLHYARGGLGAIPPEELATLDRRMRLLLAPCRIFKIKIYDAETRIIYSTDSAIIGRLDPHNRELRQALRGSATSRHDSRDSMWDLGNERRTDLKIVETYVPIHGENGEIIGSFEIYRDITLDLKMADRALVNAGAVLIATVLVVFGILVSVIRRGTHVIDSRNADLKAINDRLTHEMEQRKHLEEEALSVIEKEQRRIGRELHDGIGQQLTGISFMSKALGRKLNGKSPAESADAEQIVTLINKSIAQMRGLTSRLHPVGIENMGLESALRELVASTENLFGIRCVLEYGKTIPIDGNAMTVQLYRMVQEAISNAIKHGKAKNVTVRLHANEEHSTLAVENDGMGYPGPEAGRKGLGLHTMAYRAGMIGGTLDIRQGPEGGTIATCVFPNR